jgi:integrase
MFFSITRFKCRAVLGVRPLPQQPLLDLGRAAEGEMVLLDGARNAPLHLRKLQFKNALKLIWAKGLENDNLVQPVDELRRKLSTRRLHLTSGQKVVHNTHCKLRWRTAWRTLTKKAGLPGFRFHDLRHCAITQLAENGTSDSTIMAIAGHVSRRMLERYSHVRMEAKRNAIEALAVSTKRRLMTQTTTQTPSL